MTEEPRTEGLPQAREHHTRWPGWIWSVPIAALLIVGYLALRQITSRGPAVTVTFATGAEIKPGDTKVQYQGLQVGKVESVTLQKDLQHVDVKLSLHSDMDGHLGSGTRFWIVGGKPNFSDLSSIKTIVTGPYIGIDPHPGKEQDHYEGLSEPPAVKDPVPGTHYTLTAASLNNVSRGSPIYYRDLHVGTVDSTHLDHGGQNFTIVAFVRAPFDKLVHEHSHFWDAGAIQVSMNGSGPHVQLQSLPALFGGAVAFETPDDAVAGSPAKNGARFTLYDSKGAAEAEPAADSVRYAITFRAADIGTLQSGAAVKLANKTIGSVQDNTLEYDPRTGNLASHVTIAIAPTRLTLAGGEHWQTDARAQMNALLQHLIDQGLRARIGKTVPMVGSDAVLLAFVPNAAPARLGSGEVPELPTASRSDIQGLIASIGGVGAKLNAMPLDQIANDVHQTTQKLAELSQSQELKDSLQHLDQTLTSVDAVAQTARQQVGPILTRLRAVANEAQATVASARSLIATNGSVQNQPDTTGIGNALYELSRAARSLRELADYLDRHPEALLRGKGSGG